MRTTKKIITALVTAAALSVPGVAFACDTPTPAPTATESPTPTQAPTPAPSTPSEPEVNPVATFIGVCNPTLPLTDYALIASNGGNTDGFFEIWVNDVSVWDGMIDPAGAHVASLSLALGESAKVTVLGFDTVVRSEYIGGYCAVAAPPVAEGNPTATIIAVRGEMG